MPPRIRVCRKEAGLLLAAAVVATACGRPQELFMERTAREEGATRRLLEGSPSGEGAISREACEKLKALGYLAGAVDRGH